MSRCPRQIGNAIPIISRCLALLARLDLGHELRQELGDDLADGGPVRDALDTVERDEIAGGEQQPVVRAVPLAGGKLHHLVHQRLNAAPLVFAVPGAAGVRRDFPWSPSGERDEDGRAAVGTAAPSLASHRASYSWPRWASDTQRSVPLPTM